MGLPDGMKHFGKGVKEDFHGRSKCYIDDWREGFNSSFRILAPACYVFFASAIPALALGEQISSATDGALNGVSILAATAICGAIQAAMGGQPLMILAVTQPIVIVYIFMYEFLDDQDKTDLYLPWAAWSCMWAAFFIALTALSGLCQFIDKFTRFCGELFGMLIAVLFVRQAITGLVDEFRMDEDLEHSEQSSNAFDPSRYHWRMVNGLTALLIAFGLLLSTLLLRGARSWRLGRGWLRALLADYGVPLMVLLWTGVSYSLKHTPEGIPRRLKIPHTWDQTRNWKSTQDLVEVDDWLKVAAIVPGLIITILCFFNHNISAKLTQQKAFGLQKPPAYHYDFLLLSFMTLLCGLLGIPPTNGAIAQSPMHMKSLATLRRQIIKRDIKHERNSNTISKNTQEDTETDQTETVKKSDSAGEISEETTRRDLSNLPVTKAQTPITTEPVIEVMHCLNLLRKCVLQIKEQRLSNLLQSSLLGASLAATPILQRIPTSVLWGYFAYVAVVNLSGSEFWDRVLLLFTDPNKRYKLLEKVHPVFLETVPEDVITKFTLLQLVLLFIVFGITFAGFYGIFFPILILLMVPSRQYLMPKVFSPEYLHELDMADYEEAPAVNHEEAVRTTRPEGIPEDEQLREQLDQEIIGNSSRRRLTREEILRRRVQAEQSVQIRGLENESRATTVEGLPVTRE